MCSDREGSPLALKEYMAAGKPVVATRVGGIPELIGDGVHGLLVEPRDPPALAAALARLLGDPRLGKQLGSQARERQLAEFGIDAMVRRFEDLYVELYDAARAGARP
jgi:glycosyltransferase involved in cell wall biosynthesis